MYSGLMLDNQTCRLIAVNIAICHGTGIEDKKLTTGNDAKRSKTKQCLNRAAV